MIMLKISSLIFLIFISLVQHAAASVVIGGTRVIYDGNKKEASISVRNTNPTSPYLIQSWIESSETETSKPPFIVTPPLFRLDSAKENVLRIIRIEGNLPDDRESVVWLNVKSIPATQESDENTLQLSIKTQIKVFYRPIKILKDSSNSYEKLKFSRVGSQIQAWNPTPYHISFHSLRVDNENLTNPGMIAPFSKKVWNSPSDNAKMVAWEAINDFGGITDTANSQL